MRVLRSIAIEYPREHDVSRALETLKEKKRDFVKAMRTEIKDRYIGKEALGFIHTQKRETFQGLE